ncbi:MAG: DUF1566 domain-containing protein [Candidatus Electrothrix sp. MAN1_4]|nr:DUF1566 domain-containing protein [Candidatus Electrothrix sp. MAN1_4]
MRTFFLLICCLFSASTVYAVQTCKPDSIPASTPDSQLVDNGDGTITDLRTGLIWKKCLEGVSGNLCDTDSPDYFTWQEALQQPGVVNNAGGFAGYTDWRLPNIRELVSIVEEQCSGPAINLNRFPNTPTSGVWSGSPGAFNSGSAWYVGFFAGYSGVVFRNHYYAVRLVCGGQ